LSKVWYPQPLYAALIELLQKKQGSVVDSDLYDALRKSYDDLSFAAFNETLMKLEVRGVVHVYNLTKNKRGVELVKG